MPDRDPDNYLIHARVYGRKFLCQNALPFCYLPVLARPVREPAAILKAAQAENHPEASKEILEVLLHFMGVEVPKGVFTPKRKTGEPGRKISSDRERIYSTWIKIGEPSPFKNVLARAIYGSSFERASGTDRRKMRDKCRHALERHLDYVIDELQQRVAEQDKEIAVLQERLNKAI